LAYHLDRSDADPAVQPIVDDGGGVVVEKVDSAEIEDNPTVQAYALRGVGEAERSRHIHRGRR